MNNTLLTPNTMPVSQPQIVAGAPYLREFAGLQYLEPEHPGNTRRSRVAVQLLMPLLHEYLTPSEYRNYQEVVKLPTELAKSPKLPIALWLGKTVATFGAKVGVYDLEMSHEVQDQAVGFMDEVTTSGAECVLVAGADTAPDEPAAITKRLLGALDIPVIAIENDQLSLLGIQPLQGTRKLL